MISVTKKNLKIMHFKLLPYLSWPMSHVAENVAKLCGQKQHDLGRTSDISSLDILTYSAGRGHAGGRFVKNLVAKGLSMIMRYVH